MIEKININPFVHIHCHNLFSLLDGMGSPTEHVLRAKELGMTALAITNHNHLGGVLEFQQACKENNIKPILGVELYWTWDMETIGLKKEQRDEIALKAAIKDGVEIPAKATKKAIKELIKPYEYDTKGYHIILIAKNQIGWKNLIQIQSIASEKGRFNGRYHCDNNLLRQYSEGIICCTACIGSVIGEHYAKNKDEIAEEIFSEWKDIFKDNLFIEMQGLDWDTQYDVNLKLISLAKRTNTRLIATNDIHYVRKEDNEDHDVLLCIGTGKMVCDEDRMRYEHEFWIKDYNEMIESFARKDDSKWYLSIVRQALDNTNIIADMVDADISLRSEEPLFTKVKLPKNFEKDEKYLEYKCWKELYKYLSKNPGFDRREYEARLKWELFVINTKGYAPYMLTVDEFIAWANSNGCPTGPGRGSAAGSLVLFLLGITKVIDPIQHGLLFSRFLTMDRTALPDVDVDFCYYGRQSVIRHMEDEYGAECVAHIGTWTELGVKNGIKDVGRALNVPFFITDMISKKISEITDGAPSIKFKDLDKMQETAPEKWSILNTLEQEHSEIFRLARRFEGTKRNFGIHASGLLVTPMPITDIFPTRTDEKTGVKVTLYTGPQVEECNGVKYDFLGLKTVSVINQAAKNIDESLTWEDLYEAVKWDDSEIFDMICNQKTDALFQIESDMFKGIISGMQPTHLNDLVVLTSLGRPGPLQAGMHTKYNNRKNGLEEVVMPVHSTEDIVGDTFGTIVYQEQVMAIAKKIAGFDDNQADSYLRKALAKKKKSMMDLCKRWLIYGKINEKAPEGYDNNNPNSPMYDEHGVHGAPILGASNNGYAIKDLELFWTDIEGYASYLFNKSHAACYSYITLLTGYFKRYYPVEFFAALFSIQEEEDKRAKYITVAEDMGIEITTPDINISNKEFTPVALENKILYGLGSIKGVGDIAIDEILRERDENGDFESLCNLMSRVTKKAVNKKVGIGLIKSGALEAFADNRCGLINDFYDARKDKDERLDVALYNEDMCIDFETETLGAPITFKPWWSGVEVDESVVLDATVTAKRELIDKNGNMMAFITFEANHCKISGVVFAKTYCRHSDKLDLINGPVTLKIKGKKDGKGQLIVSSFPK